MCSIVSKYFKKIFAGSHNRQPGSYPTEPKVITDLQNEKLTAEITYEEVTIATKQMHPDKATGPDGFNPAFFFNNFGTLWDEIFIMLL